MHMLSEPFWRGNEVLKEDSKLGSLERDEG